MTRIFDANTSRAVHRGNLSSSVRGPGAAMTADAEGRRTVRRQVTVPLRFADGYATTARVFTFDGLADGKEHLALGLGDWQRSLDRSADGGRAPLVRPHSECLTGDVFGSQRCDCGPQLREAVERIADAGWVPALPAAGGPRHRPVRQAGRVRAAGRRPGHLRGERGARPRRGRAGLHRRGADAARAGRRPGRAAEQQPGQGGAAQPARRRRHRADPDRRAPVRRHNVRYLAAKADHTAHTIDLPTVD